MESNKNNNNNNGEEQQKQLRRSMRKRKFNELANDGDKPGAGKEDQNCSSKRNREEGNDLDLEVESLSRDELIKLVRKQMATTMEAQKQLETAKREASESTKQAEEFFQQNIQLEKEKAELQEDLHQKLADIVEMHNEVEEKANQINALLAQLNECPSHQHQMPTEQEMKIQLSLENWYDWLAFVPRHRLGEIVPQIGDRKFPSIVQKFLHKYGEIVIADIEIVAPYEEDPSGHPRVRIWQNNRPLRFEMAETQMPANIKSFDEFELRYFDQSVLNFMQKFRQNGLLGNVNLAFEKLASKDIQSVLCHILPLINGINSIDVEDSAQLVDFYDSANSQEIHEMNMKMMEETRILTVSSYDPTNLHANKIDLYCRWLYQPARADGKPRQLVFQRRDVESAPISLFIDRIKQDFLMATDPISFFIRIVLPKAFQLQEAICLDNDKTKERIQTKMEEADPNLEEWEEVVLQVSRYPHAEKNLIVGKEIGEKTIILSDELKIVAI